MNMSPIKNRLQYLFCCIIICTTAFTAAAKNNAANTVIQYKLSIPDPASHTYMVEMHCSNWQQNNILLKMPNWMPGYYQLMDYAKSVSQLQVKDAQGKRIAVEKTGTNGWTITGIKNKAFTVSYLISTQKQFVANSYTDSAHAYLIPENSFLYIDGHLELPVTVSLLYSKNWTKVATGLTPVNDKPNTFTAPDFDILYDCPILIGNLEELPSFKVKGIEHRFIGYKMSSFNRELFMNNLKKIVEAAVAVIGDIPYTQYTFIGIGPGMGGIEHLNNTTISFDGAGMDKPGGMSRMMHFIAHEYFHHYNVKRIRPFELGPFDYDKGNRTNLLWVSEGLSVYYEYLVVNRAGITDANTLLKAFSGNINAVENNPGRLYQSLQQASYSTWSDGPFGNSGNEPGKSISYYDKGPLVGVLLDFEIRNATQNKKSLDDVMRFLYYTYYKQKGRGFTEAEFQSACEQVAGISLSSLFEYVYTTKELDYTQHLAPGGLTVEEQMVPADKNKTRKLQLVPITNRSALQDTILKSWMGE